MTLIWQHKSNIQKKFELIIHTQINISVREIMKNISCFKKIFTVNRQGIFHFVFVAKVKSKIFLIETLQHKNSPLEKN